MKYGLGPKRLADLDASGANAAFEIGSAIRALRRQSASAAEVEALERRLGAQLAAPTLVGAGGIAFGLSAKWMSALLMACAVGLYAIVQLQLNAKASESAPREAAVPVAPSVALAPSVAPVAVPAVAADGPATLIPAPVAKLSRHERLHVEPHATAPSAAAAPEAELALLKQAQATLDHEPAAALALAEQHAQLYPHGLFTQEREILAIEAQLKLRERSAAVARARDFVARYPDSPHARRVRALLERSQSATDETIAPASGHSVTDTEQ